MPEDEPINSPPIIARYSWNAETLAKAFHWHSFRATRPLFRFALWIISIWTLIGGVGAIAEGTIAVGIFLALCGLVGLLSLFDWSARRARWQFKRNLQKSTELEWQFSPSKIVATTPQSRTETNWSALHKVVETPDGMTLYFQPSYFHFIPREGFANDADFSAAVRLAKTHAPAFVHTDGKWKLPRIRFQIRNILWTMLWVAIWGAAFAHLKSFIPSHVPLNQLDWPTMTIHVWIPLFFAVWTPTVALGALFGKTRIGIIIGFVVIGILTAAVIAVIV